MNKCKQCGNTEPEQIKEDFDFCEWFCTEHNCRDEFMRQLIDNQKEEIRTLKNYIKANTPCLKCPHAESFCGFCTTIEQYKKFCEENGII